MSDATCSICCDTYTSHLRKPVACAFCDYTACSVCIKKYLVDGTLDAHCMSCRRAWNDEFLDLNFTRAFRIGAYKKHRESVLFEREIVLLPTRQTRVEAKVKCLEISKEISVVNKELAEWEKIRSGILRKSHLLTTSLTRFTAESEGRVPPAWTLTPGERATPVEKAKFIMKCPANECRGFLSTAYKCGTCSNWACPDCLVIKGKDKDVPHTCDPGQKESVALIIKESKACPKCGERISKIDGCDQMWCVDCHTAFSWASGQIVNGVVHNPHYYEFLRKLGNGTAPRNAGDVPCGGLPYFQHLQNVIKALPATIQRGFTNIHRLTAEINDQRIQAYQGHFNINDNGDLGVKYLMKDIDKDAMKSELVKRELKRNKHQAIRAVLEMFVNTSIMMMNNLVNMEPSPRTANDERIKNMVIEYTNLRKYVNDSLLNVSRVKACSVPLIGDSWEYKQFNKAADIAKKAAIAPVVEPPTNRVLSFREREMKTDADAAAAFAALAAASAVAENP